MTNTAYKTRKLLSMLSCAEKENDGLMLTHNLQNMQRNGKQTGCYGHIMNIKHVSIPRLPMTFRLS